MQRFPPLQTSVVTDGSGNATFIYETTPSTWERWGVFICPSAPATATFDLYIGSQGAGASSHVGHWNGPNPWGPIIVSFMVQPIVKAAGLTAGTPYQMSWWGYEGYPGEPEDNGGVYPASSAPAPLVTVSP